MALLHSTAREIHHQICVFFIQGAALFIEVFQGVAAAVAVADGTTVHNVNIRKVQDILVDQDVPLPRNAKFEAKDPSYKEMVEEKQHGLYTDKAKLAKEQKEKGQALDLEFQEKFNAPPQH